MEQKVKNITCTCCPLGCPVEVTFDGENNISDIKGYTCKRGLEYAKNECTDPKRTLTSTVRVKDREQLVSVKTSKAISFTLFGDAMKQVNGLCVNAPVNVGDVLIKGICQTDADLVATKHII